MGKSYAGTTILWSLLGPLYGLLWTLSRHNAILQFSDFLLSLRLETLLVEFHISLKAHKLPK